MICTRWNPVLAAGTEQGGKIEARRTVQKKQTCLFFPNHLLPHNSSFWLLSHGYLIFQCAICLVLSAYDEGMGERGSIKVKPKATTGLPLLHWSLYPGPHRKVEHQGRTPLPLYFPIPRSHTSGTRIEFIQLISDSFSNSLFMASRVVCNVASSSAFFNLQKQKNEWVSNA